MPCQTKVGSKKKTEDFNEIVPRKRCEGGNAMPSSNLILSWLWLIFVKLPCLSNLWSYHSFSAKSLADICKKEGLVPLSPYTLQSKQSHSDNCTFSKLAPHGKYRKVKMGSECEVSEAEKDYGALNPRSSDPSIQNIFQFRIRRLSNQRADNFSMLPDEMVLRVFKWLPKQALGRVAQTCKRLKRLSEDETLWRRVDLQGRILNDGHLGVLLSRQPVFLRLARAQIRDSPKIPPGLKAPQLSYLDLSMSVISTETLTELLNMCSSLVKLSLEHMMVSKAAIEAMHSFAATLDTLNITMCYDINPKIFAVFLQKCKNLKNLNMGCIVQDWTSEELLEVVSSFPPKLEQLNVAGFRQSLTDTHVEVIVSRCPRLIDLDLSDCQDIVMCIESITTLTNLQHLALSRCYSLDHLSYATLGNMKSLRYLEVFSFFKETSLKTLKATLPGVEINQFYFSAVARPTVGIRRSTIWNVRVRD
ncbi:unnamed protein product [Allacma fusca]|uniref:F-box domain-containing protein n=1 Tax=Allacma fusca TaxID=39272 RepID=A0A8J2PR42_9HEXA|nr:unnamed protein product [Allacma fusca]